MDNQDEAFSDYDPKRDRDPLDRAEEIMKKYTKDFAESIKATPIMSAGGYFQPIAISITKIENGFVITDQGQRTVYYPTVESLSEGLRKAFPA
jgi:hypothetical protein